MDGARVRTAAPLAALLALALVPPAPAAALAGARGVADRRATIDVEALAARERAHPPARARRIAPDPPIRREETGRASGGTSTAQRARASKKAKAPSAAGPKVAASFAALDDNGTAIPPDTHGAAGPRHLMTTLNTQVRIQTRAGRVLDTVSLDGFWRETGATSVFDPKVLYDPYGERWIFTACSDPRNAASSLLMGVSATDDPTGRWHLFRVDADDENVVWADYPSIGFNKSWIVLQLNMFTVSGSLFSRSHVYVFDKGDLYRGGDGRFTLFERTGIGDTQSPATTYERNDPNLYLVRAASAAAGGGSSLQIFTVSGTASEPALSDGPVVPAPVAWSPAVPGREDFAPQLGSGDQIQNGDARMQSVAYRDGRIWATHHVFLPAGGTPVRSVVRWYELTPEGRVVQHGSIEHPRRFYAYPSIAVNERGDTLVGYSRFSDGQYASANFSFRYAADPPGTMRADTVIRRGRAPYLKTFGGSRNRWGDYSATVVDPVNDADFWTIQEYAAAPRAGDDRWGTWWARIAASGAPEVSLDHAEVAFGDRVVGSESEPEPVAITNTGTEPLRVRSVEVGGDDAGDFAAPSDCDGSLEPGETCTASVTFAPTATGRREAELRVETDARGSPHTISLVGTGVRDDDPPSTAFTTIDNAVVGSGTESIEGTTEDDVSGVETIAVTFTMPGRTEQAEVSLACGDEGRACTWTARAPLVPGAYEVTARATDRAGNAESPGPSISVTVV